MQSTAPTSPAWPTYDAQRNGNVYRWLRATCAHLRTQQPQRLSDSIARIEQRQAQHQRSA